METAVGERLFVEGRENISSGNSGRNQEEQSREMNSPHQDLLAVQNSTASTVLIAQKHEESFEPKSRQIDGELTGGDKSGAAVNSNAGINGVPIEKQASQEQRNPVTTSLHKDGGEIYNNNIHTQTTHKPHEQITNLENAGEYSSCNRNETRNAQAIATPIMEGKVTESNKEQGEKLVNQQGNSMEDMSIQSTSSNDANSKFSFAIADSSLHLTPKLFADVTPTIQNKDGLGQDQTMDHQAAEGSKRIDGEKSNTMQEKTIKQPEQAKHNHKQEGGIVGNIRDQAKEAYHNNFPKISNNFSRYDHNSQTDKINKHDVPSYHASARQNLNQQQGQHVKNNANTKANTEPAPYTVIQSFAARLRYNQAQNEIPISLNEPIHTTRQGLPAVLIDENDYYVKLAEICKYTLVGKFTNTMPRMEQVRKSFIQQTQLMGGVKITHFNSRHVYIDLDNELDYQTVWTKLKMTIEGQAMRIQAWTPDFTPEEETPIVPIWVSIPDTKGIRMKSVLLKKRDEDSKRKKEMEEGKSSKETGEGIIQEQGKSTREDTAKSSNQQTKIQKEGTGQASEINQIKAQMLKQQQRNANQVQDEQRQQGETNENQWQTQKKNIKNMQEIQDKQQTGKQVSREAANTSSAHQNVNPQTIERNSKKIPGIDLSLPSPKAPNLINAATGHTVEVSGGMDGGIKEIPTNLQEGDTKGGSLPHVMHEGLDHDHRRDYRDPRDVNNVIKQQDQQPQQYSQKRDSCKQNTKEKGVKQQAGKKQGTDQGEQSGNIDIGGTSKSKNKPSKQKRDAEKRRQEKQNDKDKKQKHELREETCNRFVMVDDNHGLDIPPLQVQYMTPTKAEQQYKQQLNNKKLSQPVEDEYAVLNSEDEATEDDPYMDEWDDNDETSEALIRAFSPYKDQTIEKEIHQATMNQSLSPRSFQQERFHFTKQDAKTVTAGRPNTRLFSSKSSQ
ncbi:uncharacterized protein [Solanum lycopersicum]|uniref:uncharacterized protein n=1 Tax=Solanum lycopersicum TaxID=4081 RepID=UPI003748C53C